MFEYCFYRSDALSVLIGAELVDHYASFLSSDVICEIVAVAVVSHWEVDFSKPEIKISVMY